MIRIPYDKGFNNRLHSDRFSAAFLCWAVIMSRYGAEAAITFKLKILARSRSLSSALNQPGGT